MTLSTRPAIAATRSTCEADDAEPGGDEVDAVREPLAARRHGTVEPSSSTSTRTGTESTTISPSRPMYFDTVPGDRPVSAASCRCVPSSTTPTASPRPLSSSASRSHRTAARVGGAPYDGADVSSLTRADAGAVPSKDVSFQARECLRGSEGLGTVTRERVLATDQTCEPPGAATPGRSIFGSVLDGGFRPCRRSPSMDAGVDADSAQPRTHESQRCHLT